MNDRVLEALKGATEPPEIRVIANSPLWPPNEVKDDWSVSYNNLFNAYAEC